MKFLQKQKDIVASLVFSFVYGLVLFFSPKVFTMLQPDSGAYIDFSPDRTSIYPTIIDIFQFLNNSYQDVIFLQILLFLISFGYFSYQFFKFKINKCVYALMYVSLSLNIYYNGFHFTILTESISFSIILIILGQLINYNYSKSVVNPIYLVISSTFLFAIKPAAGSILLVLIIYLIMKTTHIKKIKFYQLIKFIILPLLLILITENALFYSIHDTRKSVLERHFFGKAVIINLLHNQESSLHSELQNKNINLYIKDVNIYLKNIKSQKKKCLTLERYGDFENYSYFHLFEGSKLGDLENRLFVKKTFQNKFKNYIQLISIHYLNFFCVASLVKYKYYIDEPPFIEDDAFGEEYRRLIIHIPFILLGLSFLVINIYYLYMLLKQIFFKKNIIENIDKLNITLIFVIQSYLFSVATLSISNPRYLMLVFPLMIFLLSTSIFRILYNFSKIKFFKI